MNQNHTIFSLLLERLPISTAREYVKDWDKDKAKHLFGDKYRIYIPLKLEDGKIPELESPVKDMIERKYNIKFVDYGKGLVIHPLSKKITRLSRAMSKEEYAEIQHQFDNDKTRRGASNIKEAPIVCISRHPYDIAGQLSSDRGWTNCKTIIVPWGREEVEHEGSETSRLKPEAKHNLVTYLIRPDDRNINNPIARLTVHAYYAEDNPVPYFISDKAIYGTPGIWEQAYMDTVEQWLKEKQREIELDIDYKIAPGVKSWELPKTMGITNITLKTLKQHGDDINWIREHLDELSQNIIDALFINAADKGYINIVEFLSQAVSDEAMTDILFHAVQFGIKDRVKMLIPAVKNKDVLSDALAEAVMCGQEDIFKMLLPISDPKHDESAALYWAVLNRFENIVKMLIPVSDPKANNSMILCAAARRGYDKYVKLLIPVSDPKANNSMALRWAIGNRHKKCVELLIPVSDTEIVQKHKPQIQALGIDI